MRFATLGADPEIDALAHDLVQAGGRWLAACGDRQRLPSADARTESVDSWEDLLKFPSLELVIVAGRGEADDETLRKLVQGDVRLLMMHPVCTAIVAIELEMIRDDVGVRIDTLCPLAETEAFRRLQRILAGQESVAGLGAIEQVVVERRLPQRDDDTVLWALREDSELLRRLSGRMRHVNAMGEAGKGAGFTNLSVNMTSQANDVVHRWSVTPGESAVRISLIGAGGEAVLEANPMMARLEASDIHVENSLVEQREATVERLLHNDAPDPDWTDVRHALEIAEAAERSAVKGKTIELFEEAYTEEASFKGLMAIGGCGLLLLTFLVFLIWSAVEGVRLPAERNAYERMRAAAEISPDEAPQQIESRYPLLLRLWPVYPFAIFLLLQLLRLVFTKPPDSPDVAGPAPPTDPTPNRPDD